jgi:ACS family D-galactonate transporter-like MFS transporter
MFVTSGVLGLVAAVLWFRRTHNRPAEHPKINEAELRLTEETATVEVARTRLNWRDLGFLRSKRRLWGLYVSQFCSNGVLWFFLTWFPTYLTGEKHIAFLKAGFLAALPYFAALGGVMLSGYWSDRMLRRGVSRTIARKVPIMTGLLLSGSIVIANYTGNPALVVAVMSVAFFAQGMSGIGWTLCAEIASMRMLGLSGGVFNFFTNLGGAVVPLMVGVILDRTGSFAGALVFIGALAGIGLLAYLFLIDRVERLDGPAMP